MTTLTTRRKTVAATAVLLLATAGCGSPQPPRTTTVHREAPAGPAPGKEAPGPSSAGGAAAAERPFTLVASGDILPHDSVNQRARADAGGHGYDFTKMLAGVRPVVSSADLAICHMETVYGPDGGPFTGYPAFKSPPQIAAALRTTGYDSCSTASNHTLDDGSAGLGRTLDALDKAGVRHAGSARTEAEAARPTLLRAGGATVAHLAYTYGTNGFPLPEGEPWAVNLIDESRIVEDARAARTAGADVVVVSLHWGTEWQTALDDQQLTLGRGLTASATDGRPDIDLILGTHAHVPQAYEKVNGTWIVYGMGDQIAGDMINNLGARDPRGNQGTLGRFTFAPPAVPGQRWEVRKAEFLPQWYNTATGRVINLNAAIERGEDHTEVRDVIRRAVLDRGAAEDGLLMGK
ncbi:CapA family protein [Streptomyces sp. SP18CS02]|uniref:CapA family protein n=1 Tax=Streptomyces sp. SP18CS02 TaxID=3002531 RepID=UPI002E768EE0|nr:CapA family protein [Streptomyces sp. SP18CS02]MEE1754517.1 CapA family protein [Streptomyces sp. SP18CS02]